jgi:ubiquinone/menaquinone biosynthesis C-methylase UbiE
MEDQSRWGEMAGALAFQARHFAIIDAARVEAGMRVLEVATGRGEVAVLAAQAGAVVHATDINLSLAQAAERNASRAGVEVLTSVADMRDLRAIKDRYDRVLGCAALHHLDQAGAREAVHSAVRVLAPGGRALFLEPIANVPWFEAIKCAFPGPKGRPSILNRRAWKRWLEERDDRWMSDAELFGAWRNARIVARLGLLVRIKRTPQIERLDAWLLRWRPLHRFAQAAIVEYRA